MGPAVVNAYYSAQSNQICKILKFQSKNLFNIKIKGFPAGILQAPFYDSSLPK